MDRLYYCTSCKRVLKDGSVCEYCKGEELKELVTKSPVNVIGTKIKGKILKIKEDKVNLLIKDEANNKMLKEYKADQLKKVL